MLPERDSLSSLVPDLSDQTPPGSPDLTLGVAFDQPSFDWPVVKQNSMEEVEAGLFEWTGVFDADEDTHHGPNTDGSGAALVHHSQYDGQPGNAVPHHTHLGQPPRHNEIELEHSLSELVQHDRRWTVQGAPSGPPPPVATVMGPAVSHRGGAASLLVAAENADVTRTQRHLSTSPTPSISTSVSSSSTVPKTTPSKAGKGKGKRKAAGERRGLEIVDPKGVLPPGHKPARGRGRQVQLRQMTQAQIEAESEARLERNRQAARDCRQRRKAHVSELEDQVDKLEREKTEAYNMIAELQLRVAELEAVSNLSRQSHQQPQHPARFE
eukprot:m.55331 g.55331  ORF g.55331 m.55331 type:complete len:325 (+) comp7595_c0_seq3:137-1111(+)